MPSITPLLLKGLAALAVGLSLPAVAQACTADGECPSGQYCDVTGICAQDCVADVECGFGEACDPFGRCGAPQLPYPGPFPPACSTDAQCPAGSYCTLLICAYDCSVDSECSGGQICDPVGQCSDGAPPPVDPGPTGHLRLHPHHFLVAEGQDLYHVNVAAEDHDISEIRVAADADSEVSCDGGLSFHAECSLELLVAEPPRRVTIRLPSVYDSPAPGESPLLWSVRFFHHEALTVVDLELPPPSVPVPQPAEGLYEGYAILDRAGILIAGETLTSPEVASSPLRVPVGIEVFPTGEVVLLDPYGVFGASGSMVFEGKLKGDLIAATGDNALYFGSLAPELYEASVQSQSFLSGSLSFGALEGELKLSTQYLLSDGSGAQLTTRWWLEAVRTGGLPEGASVPWSKPPAPISRDEDRRRTEESFPWAQAAVAVMGPPRTLFENKRENDIDRLLKGWQSDRDGLLQCEWDPETTMPFGSSSLAAPDLIANVMCAIYYRPFLQSVGYHDLSLRTAACLFEQSESRQCRCRSVCSLHAFEPGAAFTPKPCGSLPFCARPPCTSKIAKTYGCSHTVLGGTRSCRVAEYSTHPGGGACAARYLCYRPPQGGSYTLQSSRFGDQVLAASGDLSCRDGGGYTPTALGLFANPDLPETERVSFAADMLEACMEDLSAPLPAGLGVSATALDEVYGSAGCIDLGRFYRSLEWALADARHAVLGGAPSTDHAGSALGHRLLQQWIQLHMFLAREGGNQSPLADLLSDLAVDTGPEPREVGAVLDRVEEGWKLVLHPHFARPLMAVDPSVLASPDYRPYFGAPATADPHHEQGVGLPVTMLEGMTTHLTLLSVVLEREAHQLNGITPVAAARSSRALRTLVLVRALAAGLYGRAAPAGISWGERWHSAERELTARTQQILQRLAALEARRNPLGIEENDLPLYFAPEVHITADEKFLALSSYLLNDPFLGAGTAVASAANATRDAESSWIAMRTSEVQEQRDRDASELRIDALKREYGRPVVEMCGARLEAGTLITPENVFDRWSEVDPGACFLDSSNSACVFDEDRLLASLHHDDLRAALCLVADLRTRTGRSLSYRVEALDSALDGVADALAGGVSPAAALASASLAADGKSFTLAGASFPVELLERTPTGTDLVTGDQVLEARAACEGHFPNRAVGRAAMGDGPAAFLDRPDCYLGSLGQDALAVRAAVKDVELARSELASHFELYDNAKTGCLILEEGALDIESEMAWHEEIMGILLASKRKAEQRGSLLGGLGSVLSNPLSAITAGSSIGTGIDLAHISEDIALAEIAHANQMQRIQLETQIATCYNDAQRHLVGLRSAGLRIDRAFIDLSRSIVELRNRQQFLASHVAEGRSVLSREAERTIPTVGHDYWLSANLKNADRKMRLARRAAFLAASATGYELQRGEIEPAGFHERQRAILTARKPSGLDAQVSLLNALIPHGIFGKDAHETVRVVSLRRDVLKIQHPDVSEAAAQFQRFIRQPRFAVFDEAGSYVGQRIPFSAVPGDRAENGAALWSDSSEAAERLWTVNASLIGGGVAGTAASAVVVLQKQDVFYSKLFTEPAVSTGPPYQAASVRRQRNLFLDPVLGGELDLDTHTTSRHTEAQIQARTNVASFDSAAYSDGESRELAGRALYGEYAVFFLHDSGIDLDAIEDVLLRFDYVAVTKDLPGALVSPAAEPTPYRR